MNHEILMGITAQMPMKQIDVNGRPYLRRYFAGILPDGGQWWLHHFMAADSERHLHTHPWTGTSVILCGRYTEHLRTKHDEPARDCNRYFNPGEVNRIFPYTLHRVVSVQPDTWTMLHIKPGREQTWKFIDDDGAEVVMQASPENWFENFGVRASA